MVSGRVLRCVGLALCVFLFGSSSCGSAFVCPCGICICVVSCVEVQ